jgi:CheY-like chemotaxis protein
LNILLIDDDPALLKALENVLQEDGHVLTLTSGGQSGLDIFRLALTGGSPFDVVITDLGMPYVDGCMVSAVIKELAPSTPVLLLTGWGQQADIKPEMLAYVDRVLDKPPSLHALREALLSLSMSKDQ